MTYDAIIKGGRWFDGSGLVESVRHGVTTILLGSCSLSDALGSERTGQFLRAGEPAPALRPEPVA